MIGAVLLVEDNPGDARLLHEMFKDQGSNKTLLTRVACMREAEDYLAGRHVDAILLDLGLADAQGLAAVQRAHSAAPRTPLVVLTGLDDESMAAQALQVGAQDYLIKGEISVRGLMRSLRYAIERKSMEEAVFVEKERAQVTLDCIGDAVACTDMSGNITFLNVVAETMTGWSCHEAIGRPMAEIFRIHEFSSRAAIALDASRFGTTQLPPTCMLIRRDGFEIPIDATLAPIHDRGGRGTGAVVVLRDTTAARALTQHIMHSAQHDFLTGLPNRMLLNDRISQAIALAKRQQGYLAILFLDLDGFKHINDSLGHPIGDRLLQSIAARLIHASRASDTVSRQGGDEFILLLSGMEQPGDAAEMAKRLQAAVAEPHRIDQHELHVTASIGVSIYPDDALDAETLVKNADTAMYQAKKNGRQRSQFFQPAMNTTAVERQSIEEALRRALERQEFTLAYQPKIDLKTGVITGAEALIRWTHATRGSVPPASFIPLAEECGLIVPIGAWVVHEACRQIRAWAQAGLPATKISVNVSAIEFGGEHYLKDLFALLDQTGMDPVSLELELTETALMRHVESASPRLQRLRERGVQVSIDDFGTGYSSLSYLHKFSVDALKIDQSFVQQIARDGEETHIVAAIIAMARNLNLRVVAEGVERAEELSFLRQHQCNEAQGYYFSQPVPPDRFATLLQAGCIN